MADLLRAGRHRGAGSPRPLLHRGNRRSSFSYRERGDTAQPAVWIVRAEDQLRGRTLLWDAGLLESSRSEGSYLPLSSVHDVAKGPARPRANPAHDADQAGLLALIAIVIGAMVFATRSPARHRAAGGDACRITRAAAGAATDRGAGNLSRRRADRAGALGHRAGARHAAARPRLRRSRRPGTRSAALLQDFPATVGTTLAAMSACQANRTAGRYPEYMTDGSAAAACA